MIQDGYVTFFWKVTVLKVSVTQMWKLILVKCVDMYREIKNWDKVLNYMKDLEGINALHS
jgi:hypothetical protein